jgi:hypothetical protein
MAVTLNASASAGLITTADTSTILQLQTGGTAAVTVDASQNVGIGTASPAGKLHVAGSGGPLRISGSGYATNPTEFTLGQYSSTIGYLQIPGGSTGRIDIWDGGTSPIAIFNQYGMGLSGTAPTSGSGITFPSTQQASSNVNTLDDYEEGTWTPTLGNQGTMTFDVRNGRYTKVGNMVFAQFHIDILSTGTGSGTLSFNNLPFTAKNALGEYGTTTALHGYNWTTARAGLNGLVNPASTLLSFFYGAAGTSGGPQPTIADIGIGNMLGTIVYMTD